MRLENSVEYWMLTSNCVSIKVWSGVRDRLRAFLFACLQRESLINPTREATIYDT
jgi:hypothetical protein